MFSDYSFLEESWLGTDTRPSASYIITHQDTGKVQGNSSHIIERDEGQNTQDPFPQQLPNNEDKFKVLKLRTTKYS